MLMFCLLPFKEKLSNSAINTESNQLSVGHYLFIFSQTFGYQIFHCTQVTISTMYNWRPAYDTTEPLKFLTAVEIVVYSGYEQCDHGKLRALSRIHKLEIIKKGFNSLWQNLPWINLSIIMFPSWLLSSSNVSVHLHHWLLNIRLWEFMMKVDSEKLVWCMKQLKCF